MHDQGAPAGLPDAFGDVIGFGGRGTVGDRDVGAGGRNGRGDLRADALRPGEKNNPRGQVH